MSYYVQRTRGKNVSYLTTVPADGAPTAWGDKKDAVKFHKEDAESFVESYPHPCRMVDASRAADNSPAAKKAVKAKPRKR